MHMENAATHCCPYCGRTLVRPNEGETTPVALAGRLSRPTYIETRLRDINIGLALGLAVVLFMDIGVFVRRDFTAFGFATNVLVAFGLSVLLALWYWRMRVETAATNAEAYAAYTKRMEMWNHTWYCDQCAAVFVREQ
ncbi:MAG: hypothetical protein LC793_02550 [Thermomicrobia bacterium]|nr:hypothetical protein [Thermomicrobia bacterium]